MFRLNYIIAIPVVSSELDTDALENWNSLPKQISIESVSMYQTFLQKNISHNVVPPCADHLRGGGHAELIVL